MFLNCDFSIFDEDCSGSVDYKELIIGLEIFKSSSIEEKLKGTAYIYDSLLRSM
jgi:hypothetical protein